MPDIWPLNPWDFARLIEPRKCCAYLAWHNIRPFMFLSLAAERRIRWETMRDERNANDVTWPVYAGAALDRRAHRLRTNASHLIRTVLPNRVRSALRTGQYLVSGVRADGLRVGIAADDLAGLSIDLASDCLVGATVVFERVSIRSKAAAPRPEAPRQNSPMLPLLVISEGMIGLRDTLCASVRVLFGEEFVAELSQDELKTAGAGRNLRTDAWQKATERLLYALRDGELTAYAVQAAQGHRVPLPRSYWLEWIAEWRPFLTGRVEVSVPGPSAVHRDFAEIAGWPCAVGAAEFHDWLQAASFAQNEKERDGRGAGSARVRSGRSLSSISEAYEQPLDPEKMTSRLVPLADAVDEAVRSMALSVEMMNREIIKAVRTGHLSLFGRGPNNLYQPIPSMLLCDPDTSTISDGHNSGLQLTLTSSEASVKAEYIDLAIEGDSFTAWLYLRKPRDMNSRPSEGYVGITEALSRLRRHIERIEGRVPGEDELVRIIAEDARGGRVEVYQVNDSGHALSIARESWTSASLPASAPAEKLILNGAVKGRRLVFLRAEFARWLGDRPDEADPPPKKLEHRDAAPIPLIAREWSREPGAESEEKIASRLWRAYFDGEFAFQIVDGAPADFDRKFFSAMIEINKEGEQALLGPAPRDDREFGYRALGIWAAQGFQGMGQWFRLATVESYLLPRSELTRWCARAGQAMPRFWNSGGDRTVPALRDSAMVRRAISEKSLRSWYAKRVTAFERTGTQPSREEDYRDAVEGLGSGITHQRMRAIRAELAPHWTRRGRRPNKIESK
jgi:hypothetical protein